MEVTLVLQNYSGIIKAKFTEAIFSHPNLLYLGKNKKTSKSISRKL